MRISSQIIFIYLFVLIAMSSCSTSKNLLLGVSSNDAYNNISHSEFEEILDTEMTNSGITRTLAKEAASWIGTPYKYGKAKKGEGTDCSGFVMTIFKETLQVDLPRNSEEMAGWCKKISQPLPGDLVFFATGKDKNKISHVGIMLDSDHFVHTSSSKGVIVSSLSQDYYKRAFRMFGRVSSIH